MKRDKLFTALLSAEEAAALKAEAEKQGVPQAFLLRMWIKEIMLKGEKK